MGYRYFGLIGLILGVPIDWSINSYCGAGLVSALGPVLIRVSMIRHGYLI